MDAKKKNATGKAAAPSEERKKEERVEKPKRTRILHHPQNDHQKITQTGNELFRGIMILRSEPVSHAGYVHFHGAFARWDPRQ
jgi:hypothetical protein